MVNTVPESASLEMRLKQFERELGEARKYFRNSVILCSIGVLIFLYGVFAGSIPALLIGLVVMGVFIFPVMKWQKEETELKERISKTEEKIIQQHQPHLSNTKKCPYCAEIIKLDAVLCRYCGKELSRTGIRNRFESKAKSPLRADLSTIQRLNDANMSYDNKKDINLVGANVEGADLANANLVSANLKGANLVDANMETANLVGANLSRANLQDANLADANMEGANLIGAILEGTNLVGANLRYVRMNRATYSKSTKWPEDFDPKVCGAILVERPAID